LEHAASHPTIGVERDQHSHPALGEHHTSSPIGPRPRRIEKLAARNAKPAATVAAKKRGK